MRDVLGDRVAALVRLHVPAKRYLVTVEPAYRAQLDVGSTYSLEVQGAAMTPAEVDAFEAEPDHPDAVVLRRADEAAKVHGLEVDPLDVWLPVLDQVAALARLPCHLTPDVHRAAVPHRDAGQGASMPSSGANESIRASTRRAPSARAVA